MVAFRWDREAAGLWIPNLALSEFKDRSLASEYPSFDRHSFAWRSIRGVAWRRRMRNQSRAVRPETRSTASASTIAALPSANSNA